jgi:F420-dependent oxidoreductase-like protein
MDLRIVCEPQQGATYNDVLQLALATEAGGFDAFFRSDHYLKEGEGSGLPGPTDAWISLAGLARETKRIRLGTLLTAATFRHPGALAISVATVDVMSGGRAELGLGAGWFEEEHAAYGIPFPPQRERFEKLEEQFAIIRGLWEAEVGGLFAFSGKHYKLIDSPSLPKPIQSPHPPFIVGGLGTSRTPRLAALFAAEFNVPYASIEESRSQFARVDGACRATGRDPSSMIRSVAQVVCCGASERELARRAMVIGRDVDELRESAIAGTPAEVVDRIRQWSDIGVSRLYLQIVDVKDLDHVRLIAKDVVPTFG